jgi:hypothetical protein
MPGILTINTNKKPGAEWLGDRAKELSSGSLEWHSRPRVARWQ